MWRRHGFRTGDRTSLPSSVDPMPPLRTAVLLASLLAAPLAAQHVHTPGMTHPAPASASAPTEAGQAAFAAIAAIVRRLEADPTTDWSTVDLERLRQHLIDMDDVTLRSTVRTTPVAGGARFVVRGTGRTVGAIRRMTRAHTTMLGAEGPYRATVSPLPDGAIVELVAARAGDTATERRIRALGFIGTLALGDHHAAHHFALATGQALHAH